MKIIKLLVCLILVAFSMTLITSSALAGGKQRHRWEGIAIGVGAALLGHAIYQSHKTEPAPQVVYVKPGPPRRHHHGPNHRCGHWEWQEVWVAPTYEKVWNPGHYNRQGYWVTGRWMRVQTSEGHWSNERVWVARR